MTMAVKNVAILGANKDGLSLLPVLLKDPATRLAIIADPNPDAMLFKLGELGYQLSPRFHTHVTNNLEDLKKVAGLNVIINAIPGPVTEKIIAEPEFNGMEKLSPLSAKLLWGVRVAATGEAGKKEGALKHGVLLSSLREIVDAVRLSRDRNELLSDILNLAIESTRAETGSVMMLSKEEGVLRMEIAKGMDEEVVRKIKVKLGDGIAGKVAKDGKPLLLSGKVKDGDFFHLSDRRKVQNAISVPLTVGGEVIGVVNVSSSEEGHSFTQDDLNFLVSLADLAAEVIQRASEYERLRADAAKYALWKELESSMGSDKPLNKRLNSVCRKLSELVDGLTCYIYVYDEERGKLVFNSTSLKNPPVLGCLVMEPGEGIEGWMIGGMKDVVLVDRASDGMKKRAFISLPMVVKGRLAGVFAAHIVSAQGLTQFTESFLKDMVSLVADSVFERKKIEDELFRTRRLFAVDELGLEIFSLKDSKRLLPVIVSATAEALSCEGVLLRVDEHDTGKFRDVASFGLDNKKVKDVFMPIEEETVREALRKKAAVVREFSEESNPYVRGAISCPLIHEGKVKGMLSFMNKLEKGTRYPKPFTHSDSEVLSRLVVYVEKAMPNIIEASAKKEEWGISPPQLFERRVEEELNRAKRAGRKMVLVMARAAGLKGLETFAKQELVWKFANCIRDNTRNFDTMTLLTEDTVGILFVETDDRVMDALYRSVATSGLPQLSKGVYYGHAVYPDDGATFTELFAKAYSLTKPGMSEV
ncbi:MAG: GAF domain-containing protein [Thermodesulfobacteriota bacterium]